MASVTAAKIDAQNLRYQQHKRDWEAVINSQRPRTAIDFYYLPGSAVWNAKQAEIRRLEAERIRAENVALALPKRADNQKRLPFLRLPAEIRNHIYDLATRAQILDWDAKTQAKRRRDEYVVLRLPTHHNLVAICHQMRFDSKAFVDSLMVVERPL